MSSFQMSDVPLLNSWGALLEHGAVWTPCIPPMPSPLALGSQAFYCSKKGHQNNNQVTLSWLGEFKLTEIVYKTPDELFAVSWKKQGCSLLESQQHTQGMGCPWMRAVCVVLTSTHQTCTIIKSQPSKLELKWQIDGISERTHALYSGRSA